MVAAGPPPPPVAPPAGSASPAPGAPTGAWDEVPAWAAPVPGDRPSTPAPPRATRRWPVVLVVGLVVVVALVVAVERLGRGLAASEIERRLEETGLASGAEVTVGRDRWTPVVWPALLGGTVDRVHVRITDGDLAGLPVREADYVLDGVRGRIHVLDGTVDARGLERGRVRLVLDPAVLGASAGVELSGRGDRLVDASGRTVPTELRGDELVIEVPDAEPIRVPVVDPYVLPCRPDVRVVAGSLVLSCTGDELPGVLRSPLAGPSDDPPAGADAPADTLLPPQTLERPPGG